jgi:hypothetical protein
VKGLYDRGFTREKIQRLFNVIEWVIKLSPVQSFLFKHEMNRFEEERTVYPLSQTFQLCKDEGLAEGLQRAIERTLRRRFGQPGVDLMPRVKLVTDIAALEDLSDSVQTVPDLAAFAALLPAQPTA